MNSLDLAKDLTRAGGLSWHTVEEDHPHDREIPAPSIVRASDARRPGKDAGAREADRNETDPRAGAHRVAGRLRRTAARLRTERGPGRRSGAVPRARPWLHPAADRSRGRLLGPDDEVRPRGLGQIG